MVEISRQREASSSRRRPIWLLAAYGIFGLSCLNAFKTYHDQKELVRLKLQQELENQANEVHAVGAEEHVVTAGVGSSQYGGSVRAQDKTKKGKKALGTNFKGIRPEPSDGSKDYRNNHEASDFEGFGFFVMADAPYSESDDAGVESELAELRNFMDNNPVKNLAFALHLGGTRSTLECSESIYEKHADTVAQYPSPTFVTPGISDWYDCPNKDEALGFFVKHLGPNLSLRWPTNQTEPLGIIERSEKHPELFRFIYEGVLVIGLHMINPKGEYISARDKRMETSMQWLAETVEEKMEQHEIRGVVVVGHAGKSDNTNHFFPHARKYFSGTRSEIPVLWLHASGDEWTLDVRSPLYFVGVDQRGLTRPMIVDVAKHRKGKASGLREQSDSQKIIGKSTFLIDKGQNPDKSP